MAGIGGQFVGGETFADQRQYAIRQGLPGQAGAGGAEGDRRLVLAGGSENGAGLVLVLDDGDDLGDKAIEAGVGAIGETAQIVGNHLAGGQGFLKIPD